ncbi:chemotaxis protein CheW [Candidatus Poribacteria bacterium]|nr:chemotaxis protein CheW [Candidatus Poribacteria bacterium]
MESNKNKKNIEVQLVIFRLDDEEFGLDISQVREIIRMQEVTSIPKSLDFIEGVINLRGQIIAVMDLAKRFGLAVSKRTKMSRIIVVEIKDNIVGFIVDEVPEVLRIAENNIDPTPKMISSRIHTDFIKGVGKLDSRLIIILSVDNILNNEEIKQVSNMNLKEDSNG